MTGDSTLPTTPRCKRGQRRSLLRDTTFPRRFTSLPRHRLARIHYHFGCRDGQQTRPLSKRRSMSIYDVAGGITDGEAKAMRFSHEVVDQVCGLAGAKSSLAYETGEVTLRRSHPREIRENLQAGSLAFFG